MRRWNGWGNPSTSYPLPEPAARYLKARVGPGIQAPDTSFEQALTAVPPTRLPDHPSITTSPAERLMHARGQSLPDWVALRSGRIDVFPDGVAYPRTTGDVRNLLDYAKLNRIILIPFGGGTSVVGHINPQAGERPVLTVDLSSMNDLIDLQERSRLATIGAGATGPRLENLLNDLGYTLGHFPQSFELSTLGGWIATRSSGQQSYHYGRIEDLFAGGRVETPGGALELLPHPASAAGPDLRQMILGSEGRLGVITQATVRISPLPEKEDFYGVFFPDWGSGAQAVREIVQTGQAVSMLRLSDAQETETTLELSGKERLVGLANRGLGVLGYGSGRSLLIFGLTGSSRHTARTLGDVRSIIKPYGGLFTGRTIGKQWRKSRFRTPYLRNTLWEKGYALDTLETALPWEKALPAAGEIIAALRQALQTYGEQGLIFAHLSHVYPTGASLYVTYLFRRAEDPDELVERWQVMKSAASQVIVCYQGTISHQHGVGIDHAPYLPAEKGLTGMQMLKALVTQIDPQAMMNPGKLIGPDELKK